MKNVNLVESVKSKKNGVYMGAFSASLQTEPILGVREEVWLGEQQKNIAIQKLEKQLDYTFGFGKWKWTHKF